MPHGKIPFFFFLQKNHVYFAEKSALYPTAWIFVEYLNLLVMVTFPNAKINIGLDILSKRADGYHNISTVMLPIPWHDILEIVPTDGSDDLLTVTGRRIDCPPEKNLVMKAVKLLRESVTFPPVEVHLHKIIPDGAGLGGGSADASFALVALNDLFDLGIEQSALAVMASKLGADCPFFIYNRVMLCEGIGAEMRPIDIKLPSAMYVAVVKPPVSVPTAAAYGAVIPAIPAQPLERVLQDIPVEEWQGVVKNDFEPSVFPKYPKIAAIKRQLMALGAVYASMSGSGSSVYGLFYGGNDILSDKINAVFGDCDTFVGKL